jgi:RNA polymerase sigma factor (TIGR02999 family)
MNIETVNVQCFSTVAQAVGFMVHKAGFPDSVLTMIPASMVSGSMLVAGRPYPVHLEVDDAVIVNRFRTNGVGYSEYSAVFSGYTVPLPSPTCRAESLTLWRMDPQAQVTQLLRDLRLGDAQAVDALIPIVYGELRKLAAHYLRDERAALTLQPTALVNEAYMRLVAQEMPDWEGRSHFFGVAAHLMRQILVDHARRHRSQKRGGGVAAVTLEEAIAFAPSKSDDIIALDDALTRLAAEDERKARVIELRFFGGMTADETARALNISVATVGREQRLAEAWLHRELTRTA